LILTILCLLLIGCQPNPRYRTGEARPQEISEKENNYREKEYKEKGRFEKLTSVEMIELGRIIQKYLGTPRPNKSGHGEGLDCSRFTQAVFEEYNHMKLPRTASEQFKESARIGRNNIRFGDLIFFCTNGRDISHVGIYIGYDEFIHSSSSDGVIITSMDDKYWKKRIVGLGRVIQYGQ
jgi:lipoprotein Spr